jgi:hypothetical protein
LHILYTRYIHMSQTQTQSDYIVSQLRDQAKLPHVLDSGLYTSCIQYAFENDFIKDKYSFVQSNPPKKMIHVQVL